MMASFPVPAKNVRGLLPTDKIRPAQMLPGTAVMTLLGIEYRQPEDVQPYNEFAVLIHVAQPVGRQRYWDCGNLSWVSSARVDP